MTDHTILNRRRADAAANTCGILSAAIIAAATAGTASGCASLLPFAQTGIVPAGGALLTNAAPLVHGGGIVFLARRALLRDAVDGYSLLGNTGAGYRIQAAKTDLFGIAGGGRPDGTFFYTLVEDDPTKIPFHVNQVETRSANRAQGNAFDVPDPDIVVHRRLTVEAVEPAPGYPPGAVLRRIGAEIVVAPIPLRGFTVIEQVFMPGQGGEPDRPLSELEFSRDLRFRVPIPFLFGKPLIFKRLAKDFILGQQGEPVPLTRDEQQIWPDGQVLQHVHTIDPVRRLERFKGTMILPDPGRTPVNFERIVDHDAATASSVTRTLDGIAIAVEYGKGNVFARGEVRRSSGEVLARLEASASHAAVLVLADGKREGVDLDSSAGVATESATASAAP